MTLRTRAELNSDADTHLEDNTTGNITPADVRQRVKDLADSALLAEDIGDDVQAYSAILAALAGLNSTPGMVVQTGASAFTKRTITGTANQIAVANGDGVAGAPTLSLPSAITVPGTLTLNADPSNALHAATKQYVDGLIANLGKRARVRAATTGNITISTALNNGDTLDGVTLATGDWVLVKDQSSAAQNGVYEVAASPARVAEFDTYNEHPGSLIAVAEGTANADTLWLCTSNQGGTLGTTAIAFSKMVIAGELLAGNNLSDLANASTARSNLGLGNVDNTSDATERAATATLQNKTIVDPIITGCVVEDVYTISDGAGFAINPRNGSLQEITLGASRTPVASNFNSGDSVTLRIADGTAYTITWTTVGVVWEGGSAPALATSGWTVIELWKEGSTIRGKKVGDFAS